MKIKNIMKFFLIALIGLTALVGCGNKEEEKTANPTPEVTTPEEVKHTMKVSEVMNDKGKLYEMAFRHLCLIHSIADAQDLTFVLDYESEDSLAFTGLAIRYRLDNKYYSTHYKDTFYVDDFMEGKALIGGNFGSHNFHFNKERQETLKAIIEDVITKNNVNKADMLSAYVLESLGSHVEIDNEKYQKLKIRVDSKTDFNIYTVVVKDAENDQDLVKNYQAGLVKEVENPAVPVNLGKLYLEYQK